MVVRHLVHSLGYRYRLHGRQLPGTPDLVFPSRKKVIFVHGCYWHLHRCGKYRLPKTRRSFWMPKLEENRRRDIRNKSALTRMGWGYLVIWECEVKDREKLLSTIRRFLDDYESD